MANQILQVKGPVHHESDIIGHQYHTYTPYTPSFNNNDEIRITIQSQDLNVLPSESYLFIELVAAKYDGTPFAQGEAAFVYNHIPHIFSEMRYELNGFEIDRCKNPGITSLMKCMTAMKTEDSMSYNLYSDKGTENIHSGIYRAIVPLRFLFGFCDDFKKIVLNSKHELVLVRNRTNMNMYVAANDILNLTVNKIHWKVPHISLNDNAKLSMLKTISRNDTLSLPFRSWDLYELPVIPQTTRHTWSVKTTSQVNKPRYVFVAFQTNRNNIINRDSAVFDHCNISNLKLYLNNERYPYDDLNLNFDEGHFSELFNLFQNVQQTYYNGTSIINPMIVNLNAFQLRPLFAFDCTRSDESIKTGMVDVRIEIEASQNIPANTTAFCLIVHDNLVEYSPFTSIVRRVI